jgi:hypothetical protein
MASGAREVRGTDEVQIVVGHAKYRIALEVDARNVAADCEIIHARAEAQAAVFGT